MKAETLLDSVVFQLTPTRTRYDLVIIANGKKEKIASGLLDPFLAHLETAKDQIAKGGYSIRLEPDPGTDTTWFIKDTVERFVRYVSTPEVLERVNTLELEILQINEAIAIPVEDHQSRWMGSMKGSRYTQSCDKEKAMILSKHGKHRRLSTGSITQEENSRCQLLRVLESRKTVLRKEQGMAFARAAAAGFDMDHMTNLILFAKSFGASRLLEACLRFVDLWKAKHNNGQLLEGVGAEAVPFQSESTSIRASGIIFSGDDWKEKHVNGIRPVSSDDLATESNEKDVHTSTSNTEDKGLRDQWLSHGPPVSQSYPVQGMAYCHGYPTSISAFQATYPPVADPGFSIEMALERHSMDKVYNNESKAWEMDIPNTISKIRVHQIEAGGRESRKKADHSGKRRSSMVVGNNVEHITSEGSDESRSQSASDVDAKEEIQDLQSDIPSKKHRNLSRSVNKNGGSASIKTSNTAGKSQVVDGQEGDAGNWQTFQKLLLRVQTESRSADRDMFSSKEAQVRRRGNRSQADPSIPPTRINVDSQELRIVGNHTESRGGGYCRAKNDDFLINGSKQGSSNRSLNPISQDEYQNASNLHKSSLCNASDESFIVPFRSGLHDELAKDKKAAVWDMTSDFQSARKNSDPSNKTKNQHNYEPHDLSMMPERGLEKGPRGFDPSKEFDIQIPVQNGIKIEPRSQGDISKRPREELKGSGKEKKSSSAQYGFEKRKMDSVTMRGKSSKLNALADAKARAEKLRAFKADLQKAKKEKEEEERKRLEVLKLERQKRIAARNNSKVAQISHNALQTKARKPTSHSPSSGQFRDATPTSSSPLRKMPRSSKSPLTPQKIGASVSPKPSPSSYKGSKFSDAEPATTSPLVKLLRSSKNISQSACKPQESTSQKRTSVSPSSAPIKKLLHSSSVAQSPSNPQETATQKSTRLSSSKGSKFSNTLPSFSSPLPKLPTRTSLASSLDSHIIAKPNRLSSSTHLVRNGSRQPASPVSRLKKESNGVSSGAKTVQFQAKKVFDPQGSKLHPTSVRPVNSNQMPKKTMTKDSQAQSKTTTSIKIGTSREPCGEVKKSQGKTSLTSQRMLPKKANEVALALNNNEDDPIVEKAVLTLENKTIPDPVVRVSDDMVDSAVRSCEGGRRTRIEFVSEHPALHVPPTPLSAGEADNFSDCKLDKKSSSYEVVVNPPKDASQNSSNSTITEIPNQAPFARASYIDEPTASEIELIEEYIDQKVGSERVRRACKSMDSISVEQIPEVHEKPHNRGSPRGFKELLKFRRKGQSSSSCELNSDGSAVNVCSATTVPNNVPRLKDLFSKDGHSEGTPPNASRPFSLFPPFHNKSSKKKLRSYSK